MPEDAASAKFPKPKILLLDTDERCGTALRAAGFNVSNGTFGIPYAVECLSGLHWVQTDTLDLPGYEEQKIIIANTACPRPSGPGPSSALGLGFDVLWQTGDDGEIDPRPLHMAGAMQRSIVSCSTADFS